MHDDDEMLKVDKVHGSTFPPYVSMSMCMSFASFVCA